MNIAIAADQWFPDAPGGTARVVRATAVHLAARGHRARVVVPQHPPEPAVVIVDGVEVHRTIRRSRLPTTLTDIYETRRALKRTASSACDVVLAHNAVSAAGAAALGSRVPLVFVFHASPYLETRHWREQGVSAGDGLRSRGVEGVLRFAEKTALSRAAKVLVLSEFSRSLLADLEPAVGERVVNVGGGVDVDVFTPAPDRVALRQRLGIGAHEQLLLTARRLVGRMGVDVLLDAVAGLARDGSSLRLVIIGDGELRISLERRRDELGLRSVVSFIGTVADADLRDWYRAADLFVLPTLAYEGFGMVTAEALACGTPVVGTWAGATGEILAPLAADLLATPGDVESLRSAMRLALDRQHDAVRSGCRLYAERELSWSAGIVRWETALYEAAAGR